MPENSNNNDDIKDKAVSSPPKSPVNKKSNRKAKSGKSSPSKHKYDVHYHDWEDEEICIREDENGVVHYDCEKDEEMDEVRAMMVELEVACEDGNETSCEELEEMMASLEEEKEEEKEECGREKEESEDESEEESEDEETSDEE